MKRMMKRTKSFFDLIDVNSLDFHQSMTYGHRQ